MIKILITGHGGSSNRGCEAILRSTIDIIRRHIASAEITILSFDPISDRKLFISELGDIKIPDVLTKAPSRYSFPWLLKGVERRIIRKIFPGFPSYFSYVNRSIYRNKDVVISVGGDNFTDDYGVPSHFFGELFLAQSLGALTVIWGASIGPFHTKKLEKKWAKRLRMVDLITVREDKSIEYLKNIGVKNNIRRVEDPAFLLLEQKDGAVSLHSLKSERIVGIGMSAIVSRYGLSQDKYIESFVGFGRALLAEGNTKLVLVPHVFQKGKENDDELVCQQLASKLPSKDVVTFIGAKYNVRQIKHLISQCDYFIGARTHSTIASLSSYVPTISIGYSQKAYGISMDIFGHTDYVLHISDLNEKSLMQKYRLISNKRYIIINQLRRQLPAIKRMADKGGLYLREILRYHGYHV